MVFSNVLSLSGQVQTVICPELLAGSLLSSPPQAARKALTALAEKPAAMARVENVRREILLANRSRVRPCISSLDIPRPPSNIEDVHTIRSMEGLLAH